MSNVNFYRVMYRPMLEDTPQPAPPGESPGSRLIYNIRAGEITNFVSESKTWTVTGYNGLAASSFGATQPVVGGFINSQRADHVVAGGEALLHSIFHYRDEGGAESGPDKLVISFSSSTDNPPIYWDTLQFSYPIKTGKYTYHRRDALSVRSTTSGTTRIYSFYFDSGFNNNENPIIYLQNGNNLSPDSADNVNSQFAVISYSASSDHRIVMGYDSDTISGGADGCNFGILINGMQTYWFSGSSPSLIESLGNGSFKGLSTSRIGFPEAGNGPFKFFDGSYYSASVQTGSSPSPQYLGPMIGGTYSPTTNQLTFDFCSISGSMTINSSVNAIYGWYAYNNNELGAMTSNYSEVDKELLLDPIAPSVNLQSLFYYLPNDEVWVGYNYRYNTGGIFPRYHGATNLRNIKTLYIDNGTINGYVDLQDLSKIKGYGYAPQYGVFTRYKLEYAQTISNPNWVPGGIQPYTIPNPDYSPIAKILREGVNTTVRYSFNKIVPY